MWTAVNERELMSEAGLASVARMDSMKGGGLFDPASKEKGGIILRWGGIAGMLGALLFILTAVALLGLSHGTSTPEEAIQMFPENRNIIALGESLYLVMVVLWAILLLGLYRALRRSGEAPALVGTGLGFIGIVSLTVGALPFVAFTKLSDIYHASGTTAGEKAQLVVTWQAIQGLFNETDTVGYILVGVAIVVLGVAMLRSPSFSKRCGAMSMVFGVTTVLGMCMFGVDSDLVFPFVLITFVVYPMLFGWKLYQLTRMERGTAGSNG